MKNLVLVTLAVGTMFVQSQALAGNASTNKYSHTCRFEVPLDSDSRCHSYTVAGRYAESCAMNEAMINCREDGNADCLHLGSRFRSIISSEFIGYKACEVTVSVRGYKLN